jgi:hypothetical protein
MRLQLKLEELAQFLFVIYLLHGLNVEWWVYLLLVIGPDIGMVGYAINARIGAVTYNLFHHKGIAIIVLFIGLHMAGIVAAGDLPYTHPLLITGLVLFGHASMDRIFGYGLKYPDHFKHTHLGWIGGVVMDADRQQEIQRKQRI